MRGTTVIESRQWEGPAVSMVIDTAGLGTDAGWDAFSPPDTPPLSAEIVPAAQESQKDLEKMINAYHAHSKADQETGLYLDILADDLSGLISSKTGNMAAATMQVQRAAATYDGMAFDFGPPPILKPPRNCSANYCSRTENPNGHARPSRRL